MLCKCRPIFYRIANKTSDDNDQHLSKRSHITGIHESEQNSSVGLNISHASVERQWHWQRIGTIQTSGFLITYFFKHRGPWSGSGDQYLVLVLHEDKKHFWHFLETPDFSLKTLNHLHSPNWYGAVGTCHICEGACIISEWPWLNTTGMSIFRAKIFVLKVFISKS